MPSQEISKKPANCDAGPFSKTSFHHALSFVATPTWYSLAESLPETFVSLPHLGDPEKPLEKGTPGEQAFTQAFAAWQQ